MEEVIILDKNEQKQCPKCGVVKDINEFYKNKSRKDGYSSWCRNCDNANNKKYVQNNKEHMREYYKGRYWKNPEKYRENRRKSNIRNKDTIKESRKIYYQNNKDLILSKDKIYRDKHRDEINTRNRQYYQNHKDEFIFRARERKKRIRETKDGTITKESLDKMYEKQLHRCDYCGCDLYKYGKHLDHIFPLIRGGRHTLSNVHWVCPKCNLSKNDKTEEEWFDMLEKQGIMSNERLIWHDKDGEGNDINESA